MWLIFLVLIGLASSTDVLLNFPLSTLLSNGYILCSVTPYGLPGPSTAEIQACGGTTVYIGCRPFQSEFATVLAAESKANVFNSNPAGVLSGTGSARFYHFPVVPSGRMGFVNDSQPLPTDCLSAGAPNSMCWQMNGTQITAGGTCGNVYATSNTVERIVLTRPCEGLSPGNPCVTNRGLCETGGTCSAGLNCTGAVDIPPPTLDQCEDPETLRCNPLTGTFTVAPHSASFPCDDGNVCTTLDSCGTFANCSSSVPLQCPPPGQCQFLIGCNAPTIGCEYGNLANGTACSDGDASTLGDQCLGGVCVPGAVPPCPPPGTCSGPGVRSNVTGLCEFPPLPDGSPCNSTDPCAAASSCQTGVCAVTANITCVSTNPCQSAGACVPNSGCQFTNAAVGTPCDDGNPCTNGTTCNSLQQCVGGSFSSLCPAPSTCMFDASPQDVNGTCQCPLVFPLRPDGSPCDDGDACTLDEFCLTGSCTSSTTRTCPGDACNDPTTCNPTTECFNPKPDGTACPLSNPCWLTCECINGTQVPTINTAISICVAHAGALGWALDALFF
jgi:hypothetical protein